MIEISTFQELETYLHQKMLIIVSTNWCKPCKEVKKCFEQFLQTHHIQDALVIKIDFDQIQEDEELMNLLKVKKIPTFLMMKDGDLEMSVTSSQWELFRDFVQENFYVEKKELEYSDDF